LHVFLAKKCVETGAVSVPGEILPHRASYVSGVARGFYCKSLESHQDDPLRLVAEVPVDRSVRYILKSVLEELMLESAIADSPELVSTPMTPAVICQRQGDRE
jgi:hypothetical protein